MAPNSSKLNQHNHHKHPLGHFLNCCLGDEPTPISNNIQNLRYNYDHNHQFITQEAIKDIQSFFIKKDMIVQDLIINFPQIKNYLQDLHPLGLLSPNLNQLSLEMFFHDIPANIEDICLNLNKIIHT